MTSSPLFASVAEAIVILAPIVQVGWRSACSGVTAAISSAVASRNGPPDAVRTRLATAVMASPTRHCQIAECSESIGRSQASGLAYAPSGSDAAVLAASSRASGITRCPPATRVSLFAVATTLPARSAARTGRRLTTPPVATMTRSTSSRVASASSASAPPTSSVPVGRSRAAAAPSSASATAAGRKRAACSPSSAPFDPVARAVRRKASGCASRTSTVWRPIEPVEPRSATRSGPLPASRLASAKEGDDIERHDGGCEHERIDAVEHPAVAGDERARILRTCRALDDRLCEIAGLGGKSGQRAEEKRVEWVLAEPPQEEGDDDGRGDHPTDEALDGLGRGDMGQEMGPADALADKIGAGVIRPDRQHEEQDPATFRPERVK